MDPGGQAATVAFLRDDTDAFFLRDASLRLTRSVEFSIGYFGFVVLLYIRFLTPGGARAWRWFQWPFFWVSVFLPLFVLDWRRFKHCKYLRDNRQRFPRNEAQRFFIIVCSEFSYKALLCAYLSMTWFRDLVPVKLVMLPYAAGYVLHFILGHILPFDDGERAEGCNVVAGFISEVGKFLQFVLVVSVSLKATRSMRTAFDWQTAFWPCWGLEGIILMSVLLLLPMSIVSLLVDRARFLMFAWAIASAMGLGLSSYFSTYHLSMLLDHRLCQDLPCIDTPSVQCHRCRYHLEMSLLPWCLSLPTFALVTILLKHRLAAALHRDLYQAPQAPGRTGGAEPEQQIYAQPPVVMFRITPTYYTRVCDPVLLDLECHASYVPSASMGSQTNRLTGSMENTGARPFSASMGSSLSTFRGSATFDRPASLLSFRGSTFTDIVESEQLCFICFDSPPQAALLECGHAGMCVTCAVNLMERSGTQARCPICRNYISNVVRLRSDIPVPQEFFASRTRSSLDQRSQHGSLTLGIDIEATGGNVAGARHLHSAAVSAAVSAAADVAVAVGQPLAVPPWPSSARRLAVMVEVVRRPSDRGGSSWRFLFGS